MADGFVNTSSLKNLYDILNSPYFNSVEGMLLLDKNPIKEKQDFLDEKFILNANRLLQLPDEAVRCLIHTINMIKSEPELKSFVHYCNSRIFNDAELSEDKMISPERLVDLLGAYAPMFPAVVLLSGLEGITDYYSRSGIGEEFLVDTLSDVRIWMEDFYKKNGLWGLEEINWVINHFCGRIFRVGRLQFMPKYFDGNLVVYKNKFTGEVCALSGSQTEYRDDGQVNGTNGIYDRTNSFKAQIWEDEKNIYGNFIAPKGFAEREQVKLSKSDWVKVLDKGDIVLDIHIPTGARLTHELCGESFTRAVDFFQTHFPDVKYKAFVCTSWLLDSQLQEILGRESNVVRFQREFYLYPVLSDDSQTIDRVFGVKPEKLDTVSCSTSLQHSILDYIRKGNHMRMGGMFLLKDDLDWGRECYQKDFGWVASYMAASSGK